MEHPPGAVTTIDWDTIDAVLFDLDGVLTPTAEIHERAWKSMFDTFLAARAAGNDWEPFSADDYLAYVDGKRRVDGVRSFLASRRITERDHADQLSAGGTDRHAPDLLLGHPHQHVGELVVGPAGGNVPGHGAEHRRAAMKAGRKAAYRKVAVGDDADDEAVIDDRQRSDIRVPHEGGNTGNAFSRRHRSWRTAHHVPDLHRLLLKKGTDDPSVVPLMRARGRYRNKE